MAITGVPRLYQFQYSPEPGRVTLHAHISFGGTGAPTLQKWNPTTQTYATAPSTGWMGIVSVTRTGAGLYTIALTSSYQRLLGLQGFFSIAGGTTAIVAVANNSSTTAVTSGTAPVVAIACLSSTATAADPDSGSTLDLDITLQNSTGL